MAPKDIPLSPADDSALDGHLLPGLQPLGVPRELPGTAAPFQYNNLASLREAIQKLGGRPAASVMEPMRSQFPEDGFIQNVQALAEETGAFFILDEVTSGLRFGFPGAHSKLGFEPDIAVYAKAMSNGFPFGVVVGRAEIMDAANRSFISSSYWTDAVGTAAAQACLEKIEKHQISQALWESGEQFQADLRALASSHQASGLEVGGMPPSPSLSFGSGAEATAAKVMMICKLVGRGFLAPSQLYLMHAHQPEQRAQFLTALDETLGEIDQEIAKGSLVESAGTPHATNTFARLP